MVTSRNPETGSQKTMPEEALNEYYERKFRLRDKGIYWGA